MKSRITRTVALAALMAGAAGGAAYAEEGWYVRGDVGYSFEGGLDIDGTPAFGGDTSFEDDWYEGLGLGYDHGNGLRIEGEMGHRWNSVEPTATVDLGGDAHAWSLMLNGFYDINTGGFISPYVGLGVGAARVVADSTDATTPAGFDDSDTALAGQAMVGVNLAVSDRLDLDIGYRYFIAPGLEFDGFPGASSPYEVDYDHHAVTMGLRFAMQPPPPPPPPPAPPPPPPPPPAPPPPPMACPASNFTIYFEWDRSNLNQAGVEVIDAAIARARQCNLSNAIVVGHTDTSGSADYNVALSERRASVVADALVARGLPAASVNSQARGETDLAVPTRDGVREPNNRRAAVTITFR